MSLSRRDFCKNMFGILGAGAVLSPLFMQEVGAAEERRRARTGDAAAAGGGDLALPFVQPGAGVAASLNYVFDHKDVKDAKLKSERQGVSFDKQHCNGCMLYTKAGNKDGGEVGKCQLFAGQLVKGTAWCSSWTKKA